MQIYKVEEPADIKDLHEFVAVFTVAVVTKLQIHTVLLLRVTRVVGVITLVFPRTAQVMPGDARVT